MTDASPSSPRPTAPIDWDAPITLADAAAISGLAVSSLRTLAHTGQLHTVRVGARLHTTTRRWRDDYLRGRGTPGGRGKPPKPLPADYQAPPRRGRPPKARTGQDTPAVAQKEEPPREDEGEQ